jgi:hypothetical protein
MRLNKPPSVRLRRDARLPWPALDFANAPSVADPFGYDPMAFVAPALPVRLLAAASRARAIPSDPGTLAHCRGIQM